MDKTTQCGLLEMVAAMLIAGTIGWLVMLSGQTVLDVVFWRCVFGAATLLATCALMGFLRPDVLNRHSFLLIVLNGVAIVANWVLLFASYSRASTAIGTAVYNVQPFIFLGLAALFLCEKITLQKLAWLAVSFAGMLAIVGAHHGQGESGAEYLLGIALALSAALMYAVAVLIIKRLRAVPPPHLIALIQVSTGVLLLAPMANFVELPTGTQAWSSLLTLGVVHTGLMYVLLYGAIQKLPTALIGALSFIYPIAAIFVGWFAFGHRLELLQWIGVAAILVAAAGIQLGWRVGGRRVVNESK